MSQKYIALFPNNGPSPLDTVEETGEEGGRKKATQECALHVRKQMADAMQRGELSAEPETELAQRPPGGGGPVPGARKRTVGAHAERKEREGREEEGMRPVKKHRK